MTKKKSAREPQVQKFRTVDTINDLMRNLDEEIAAIKDGNLSESKARTIAKNRNMQLKSFELVLMAARIEGKYRPEMGKRLGLPAVDAPAVKLVQ